MKKIILKIYKKILYAYRSDSNSYIKYLKKKGVTIGKNVTFYEPNTNYIDVQKGFLVQIGNNVEITRGVVIITHDYSWSVYKQMYGTIIGSRASVKIGNNVFIGINSIILKGVTIGDNVIIGANSVVTKDIPSNSVVAGNPAKVINNIENLYKKRTDNYIEEAKNMFKEYYKKYMNIPKKDIFDEFFWLFEERSNKLSSSFLNKIKLTNNTEETMKNFINTTPKFKNYDEFCSICLNEINEEKEE